ncbi:hypothetical protein BABINDRAFT_166217 [Babjeviella inositovora NRRL Y-12698]|uniref:Uncharacterized protein n=1 Tax=Babjeviella inositovora NRRL Y-12698 TaxID=984486 RepID=A0A1E3QUE2_9ASCO|nr:uncharacterized protein BABINDRAFT_166217 [Babjeviella inositovora NRRL Y-12698]ODQ80612.1 hypothetical protein BABINDRAFT_166217 [Babjeviella inositovora NRRL Y-12698]
MNLTDYLADKENSPSHNGKAPATPLRSTHLRHTTPLGSAPRHSLYHSASKQKIISETAGLAKLSLVKKNLALFGPSIHEAGAQTSYTGSPIRRTGNLGKYPIALSAGSQDYANTQMRGVSTDSSVSTSSTSTVITDPMSDTEVYNEYALNPEDHLMAMLALKQKEALDLKERSKKVDFELLELQLKYSHIGKVEYANEPKAGNLSFSNSRKDFRIVKPEFQEGMGEFFSKAQSALSPKKSLMNLRESFTKNESQDAPLLRTRQSLTNMRFFSGESEVFSPSKLHNKFSSELNELREDLNGVKLQADEFVNKSISMINQRFKTKIPQLGAPTVDRSTKPVMSEKDYTQVKEFDLSSISGTFDADDTFARHYDDSDYEDMGEVEEYTDHRDTRF